jgi:hypothetical protein
MKKFAALIFLAAVAAGAQVSAPGVTYVASAPSGSCGQSPPVQVLNSSGAIYTCANGTWAVQGGGSPSGVTEVIPGTNVTCSPNVGGSCTGNVTINASGGTDTRPNVVQVTGKSGNLAAGGTYQIFSVPATASGTITEIHITLGATGGDTPNMVQNSTLQIDCDGNTISVPFGLFFMAEDAPVVFNTDYISVPVMGSTFTGNTSGSMVFNRRTWINFYNNCTMTLVNASSTASANVFADITYRSGTPVGPASRAYWNAYSNYLSAVVPNTGTFNTPQVYLMPTTTITGGGEVEAITYFVNSTVDYHYMESGPVTWTDGNIATQSGGGEDWSGCGYYCNIAAQDITLSRAGFLAGTFLQDKQGTYDYLTYRFFNTNPADNVLFNSSLAVSSANGDSSYSTSPSVAMRSLVTFWTANPTLALPTFSPAAGGYSSTQTVTISGAVGTTLCYTTDGSTPTATTAGTCTHGSTYSTPVSISTSTTLNAIATQAGALNSSVASGIYSLPNTFAFVGSAGIQCGTGSGTTSCTLSSFSPTAGHELVICGSANNAASGAFTLTLTGIGSNVATPLASNANNSYHSGSGQVGESCWVVNSAVSGSIAPVITPNVSAAYVQAFYIELSSTNPIVGIDAQTANSVGSGSVCPFGAISTATSGEMLVAYEASDTGGASSSLAGGSPNAWVQSNTVSGYPAMYYQLNASKVTSQTYNLSITAAGQCASQIVALR